MTSLEEILVTFLGRDEVSPVANNIANSANSALNSIGDNASSSASNLANQYNSAFDSISRGLHTMNVGMLNLDQMNGQLMQSLGSTKTAMDWVYGTTSKEDTNKVLVQNMAQTQEEYESLYATVDRVTDSSLTSMQDLIPALNAFRSATGATAGQLESTVTEDMAKFGEFVLAQTGSTQLSLTAMMDLSKGIKNRFASLDQYGISADALQKTGLWKQDTSGNGKQWKGDEKDLEGYMAAVSEVIGDTSALMDTNEGLNAQMGKMWSRAGKRIGHEMMPGLKSLKQMFLDLDNEMDGNLSTSILRVSLMIEEMHQKVYQLNTLWDGMRNLSGIFKSIAAQLGLTKGGIDSETAATKLNSQAVRRNTADIEANTIARQANMDVMLGQEGAMAGAGAMASASTVVPQQAAQTATSALTDEIGSNTLYFGQNAVYDALQSRVGGKDDNQGEIQELIKQIKIRNAQNIDELNDALNGGVLGKLKVQEQENTTDFLRDEIRNSQKTIDALSEDVSIQNDMGS